MVNALVSGARDSGFESRSGRLFPVRPVWRGTLRELGLYDSKLNHTWSFIVWIRVGSTSKCHFFPMPRLPQRLLRLKKILKLRILHPTPCRLSRSLLKQIIWQSEVGITMCVAPLKFPCFSSYKLTKSFYIRSVFMRSAQMGRLRGKPCIPTKGLY
jgi:hypothetical protein